jgi:hypothetical protein
MLQDIYIIFKKDILYEDVNKTLFTWIINNARNINESGYYVKLIELTDKNIDTIASLNVKTLPALLIDSEVKSIGGNKIKNYIIELASGENEESKQDIKKSKPVAKQNENDMNDWIMDQLKSQAEDGDNEIDEGMGSDTIMRKTQEMRQQRDSKVPAKHIPKRQQEKKINKSSGSKDADDILLDKMFDNQQIT